jgi:hypothetical protein
MNEILLFSWLNYSLSMKFICCMKIVVLWLNLSSLVLFDKYVFLFFHTTHTYTKHTKHTLTYSHP